MAHRLGYIEDFKKAIGEKRLVVFNTKLKSVSVFPNLANEIIYIQQLSCGAIAVPIFDGMYFSITVVMIGIYEN